MYVLSTVNTASTGLAHHHTAVVFYNSMALEKAAGNVAETYEQST
jgi:hypothetical protein